MTTLRTHINRLETEDGELRAESGPAARERGKRKKVAFVIAHLGPGGAQRVAVNAAKALVERGCDVHIIVIGQQPGSYEVDPRVVLHAISPGHAAVPTLDAEPGEATIGPPAANSRGKPAERVGLVEGYIRPNLPPTLFRLIVTLLRPILPVVRTVGIGRRAFWLRQKIERIEPDAVIAFLTQTNIMTVLATRGIETHTVICERNDPRLQRHRSHVELLRWAVYRWADVVTANSKGALASLQSFVPAHKLAFLPNPLMAAAGGEAAQFAAPTVITVGRLVEQKGLDVLLAAWAEVHAALPHWRLALVGGGPLEAELKALAARLGVGHSIDWLGHVSDPYPLLRASKFFVLTSRFEGTPNALLEAMACGLPAVVSDASPGPCELVGTDEGAGLIVPVEDADATAKAILRLARDETLRRRLGTAARERVREHEPDQAIEVWLRLLRCE